MEKLKEEMKKSIKRIYGSNNEFLSQSGISSERFYNFMKNEYNPTVKTLNNWLKALDLELTAKKLK